MGGNLPANVVHEPPPERAARRVPTSTAGGRGSSYEKVDTLWLATLCFKLGWRAISQC